MPAKLAEFSGLQIRVFIKPLPEGFLFTSFGTAFETEPVIEYQQCPILKIIIQKIQYRDGGVIKVAVYPGYCCFI